MTWKRQVGSQMLSAVVGAAFAAGGVWYTVKDVPAIRAEIGTLKTVVAVQAEKSRGTDDDMKEIRRALTSINDKVDAIYRQGWRHSSAPPTPYRWPRTSDGDPPGP